MVCKSQKSFEEMVQPNKNIVLQESKKFWKRRPMIDNYIFLVGWTKNINVLG